MAYEEMVSWATDGANWATIESELTTKGVKVQIASFCAIPFNSSSTNYFCIILCVKKLRQFKSGSVHFFSKV